MFVPTYAIPSLFDLILSLKTAFLWEISSFRRDVNDVYPPQRVVPQCCWIVLYRLFGTTSSSIFKRQADRASLNHDNLTDKLSRKVGKQLSKYAAQQPRTMKVCVWYHLNPKQRISLFFLFCTMTNKCTIISQIITPLHVSTLSRHPHGACNQYLAKLHKYFKCSCW